MIPLHLPANFTQQIQQHGAQAYPDECCGIMYGLEQQQGGSSFRIVERLERVENVFAESERRHRFSISPEVVMAAEKRSGEQGRLVPAQPAVGRGNVGW